MTRHRFATLVFAPALALLALSACSAEVPAAPTYTNEVSAILTAHCVRCHGAGDTLNSDPTITIPVKAPMLCYLQRYDDEGDCTMTSTCKRGAGWCGSTAGSNRIVTYVNYPDDNINRMPPKPADRLGHWEIEVLTRWSGDSPAR